jgi:hypothetical protein
VAEGSAAVLILVVVAAVTGTVSDDSADEFNDDAATDGLESTDIVTVVLLEVGVRADNVSGVR